MTVIPTINADNTFTITCSHGHANTFVESTQIQRDSDMLTLTCPTCGESSTHPLTAQTMSDGTVIAAGSNYETLQAFASKYTTYTPPAPPAPATPPTPPQKSNMAWWIGQGWIWQRKP